MDTEELEARRLGARAVIWDVDGTLVDSGALHFESWEATLRDERFPLSFDQFQSTFGQRNDAVLRSFFGSALSDAEIERIASAKEIRYRELVRARGIEPLPGVRAWLATLQAAGWKQAIASSAPIANVQAIVAALDLGGSFEAIVSGDEVRLGKPDPASFLLAAERLGVDPVRCVVVEDAPAGVAGARAAGMRTIGVLFSHPALDADVVVPSLDLLPADAFDVLVPVPL